MNENPYESKPDYTPDEYYQKISNQENAAEQYARQGEAYYGGAAQTVNTENVYSNSQQSQPSQPQYTSNYNPNNRYSYTNPAPKKPKVKKEKKPVTYGMLCLLLIASIIISTVISASGGFIAGILTNRQGGLVINKANSSSPSFAASNSSMTTTQIVEKAADSVVEITTEAVVTGSFSQQYIQQGAGSGVIISEDGYIITNYHVIEDATQISITLRNEKEYTKVEIVGIYESGDIALLKIKTNDKFTPAVMGDSSKLKVGDYAVAIGNPLGQLGGTVTDGIISALDRKVTIDDETMNLLQTNAEISPGNSGGGLFDGNGELIGIVNAKSSKTSSEGLGFAIPVNDVVDVLSDLKEYGYVKGQIDLGMSLSDVTSTAQAWMYGANKTGVYVTSVDIGSNAEKAGFQSGDIIQQVNGTKVTSTKEVNDIIKTLKVGDSVSFKVYRNGSTGVLKMKLAEYKPSTFKSSNTQEERNDQHSLWNLFHY